MRNNSYDLHQPTDSFHDNQTHFYMKGFIQRLVLKQRHKDTFIHELLTGAFDFVYMVIIETQNRRPNNIQKTSAQSYKTQIKILLFPGLA